MGTTAYKKETAQNVRAVQCVSSLLGVLFGLIRDKGEWFPIRDIRVDHFSMCSESLFQNLLGELMTLT